MLKKNPVFSIYTLAVMAIVVLPFQALALQVDGLGKKLTHTCADKEQVSVTGINNEVTLSGTCGTLNVQGSGHKVSGGAIGGDITVSGTGNVLRIDLPPKASVAVTGVDNDVQYRVSPAGAEPVINSQGINNRVRAQEQEAGAP